MEVVRPHGQIVIWDLGSIPSRVFFSFIRVLSGFPSFPKLVQRAKHLAGVSLGPWHAPGTDFSSGSSGQNVAPGGAQECVAYGGNSAPSSQCVPKPEAACMHKEFNQAQMLIPSVNTLTDPMF
jgi:hypothetical protein